MLLGCTTLYRKHSKHMCTSTNLPVLDVHSHTAQQCYYSVTSQMVERRCTTTTTKQQSTMQTTPSASLTRIALQQWKTPPWTTLLPAACCVQVLHQTLVPLLVRGEVSVKCYPWQLHKYQSHYTGNYSKTYPFILAISVVHNYLIAISLLCQLKL